MSGVLTYEILLALVEQAFMYVNTAVMPIFSLRLAPCKTNFRWAILPKAHTVPPVSTVQCPDLSRFNSVDPVVRTHAEGSNLIKYPARDKRVGTSKFYRTSPLYFILLLLLQYQGVPYQLVQPAVLAA